MPQMAAITVKKADGTTDVVYDIKSQSAGDGTWATWRQDTGNTTPFSARPTFSCRVTESAKGIRRVDLMFVFPYFYTDTNTQQVVLSPLNVSFKNGVLTVPQGIPTTFINESTAQFSNLVGSTHMKLGLGNQTAYV